MSFTARMPPNHQFMLNSLPMEPVSRTYQYRKIMKPMLERKRRARINKCLDELKDLMTGTLQADGENVSKLEKADILELTVRHLQRLREKNALFVRHNESLNMEKFWSGFQHCAAEVSQFLNKYDQQISGELIQHISSYVPNIRATPGGAVTSNSAIVNSRVGNFFTAPRAVISRELTAYNQRIPYNKITVGQMPIMPINSHNMHSKEEPQMPYEMGREMKKELVEEGNSVWRPW
ncbi:enhancer of split mgamma protein [Lucilia cuprina]|uniref:enhancer of split mgamma protein n=1 Tax=Lucilia cuprina TaxID=7375 RepID=UPI001F0601C8|nr:enhancer of split mgamma protein [Lucilia cuprina]